MDNVSLSVDTPSAVHATASPAFLVGRDAEGHWLAVETHGIGGGYFASRDAAIHYARDETGQRAGAVLLVEARISLAAAPVQARAA